MTKKSKPKDGGAAKNSADAESVMEIEQSLAAFKATTGLEVCVKLLHAHSQPGRLAEIAARHALHRSAFCMEVKRTRTEQCKECDLRDVPARCARDQRIFSHVCHAGAGEVIIPLFIEEALAAVVYVGQFRTGDDQPGELRRLSVDELSRVESLARMLGAYLGEKMRMPRFVSESSRGYRDEAIRRFLEKNLRENPSVSDLARHLGLSATRTAHAVREATGSSFVELRDEMRMARAKNLLRGTYHKVAHVAAECGFSSAQYFHRIFRRQTKTTPLAFRKRHRTEV